ncbi:MAG: hypothetical protein IPM01_31240 [Burkholderiaceae bacterium]|nr:hypothetical protein [Burkholderiaceae bacterium]
MIGTEAVVRSKPDGYTMLLASAPLATNPGLMAKLPPRCRYDRPDPAPPGRVNCSISSTAPASCMFRTGAAHRRCRRCPPCGNWAIRRARRRHSPGSWCPPACPPRWWPC